MTTDLTQGQLAVLRAFHEFGPMTDVALSVYVHHVSESNMSSSGIRTRRAELGRKGLITAVDTKLMKSGRSAAVHDLTDVGAVVASRVFDAALSAVLV